MDEGQVRTEVRQAAGRTRSRAVRVIQDDIGSKNDQEQHGSLVHSSKQGIDQEPLDKLRRNLPVS